MLDCLHPNFHTTFPFQASTIFKSKSKRDLRIVLSTLRNKRVLDRPRVTSFPQFFNFPI